MRQTAAFAPFADADDYLERRAAGHEKTVTPLARPPQFVVCPLMREIRAFRYFWPAGSSPEDAYRMPSKFGPPTLEDVIMREMRRGGRACRCQTLEYALGGTESGAFRRRDGRGRPLAADNGAAARRASQADGGAEVTR